MLNDEYILARKFSQLFLMKIDYNEWKINVLSSADTPEEIDRIFIRLVFDSTDKRKFLIYCFLNNAFLTGRIEGNQIVFDEVKHLNEMYRLTCVKLVGQTLSGFKAEDTDRCEKFFEIDINTLVVKETPVPSQNINWVSKDLIKIH